MYYKSSEVSSVSKNLTLKCLNIRALNIENIFSIINAIVDFKPLKAYALKQFSKLI